MSQQLNTPVHGLLNDTTGIRSLKPQDFTNERFGLPTVEDIFKELEKPGRDPRPEFKTATFKEGVNTHKDLQPAMILEGVITNVTNFGAFVDIGVHQDGLVHISALSDTFVKDPRTVVKAGDIVKVKVMEVDIPRKRIALSMRLNDEVNTHTEPTAERPTARQTQRNQHKRSNAQTPAKPAMGSMGDLLKAAMNKPGSK
jgi:uncharacterized protein